MRWKTVFLATVFPVVAAAQVVPTLTDTAPFTLALPYVEYSVGGNTAKNAFAFNIKSSSLPTFMLDTASVRMQTAFSNAANAPQLTLSGSLFQLAIPYLEFAGGGATKAYSLTLASADLNLFTPTDIKEVAMIAAPSAVTVANVNAKTVGSTAFSSSTQLTVSWKAPTGYTPDHYRIYASETVGNTNLGFSAQATDTSANLTGLKSGTAYAVAVKACKDSACTQAGTAAAASGKTSDEVWQLQGAGAATTGLTKVVSDGNVRIAVMRYGSDAPDAVKGRMQLYYGPSGLGQASGLATALTGAAADSGAPASYLSFTSGAGTSGLQNPTTAATLVREVNAGQALPMSAAAGANVRLYFEANGSDGKTRVMYINSRDGYVGKDFNSGAGSVCQAAADYNTGGGCEPIVAIPIEGDANGNAKISNARQFKIGFPMQDDWRWNEAAGTFMLFTVDTISGCTTSGHNQAYAVWNGSKWVVQYEANGCPKLFKSAQAATPVHLGGARYKAYFGDTADTTGKPGNSPLPFLGPKKVLYGDGAISGSSDTLEFEDWETPANARGVTFLWPNGDALSATSEGFIDDFMAVAPTGSLDFQVLYVAITEGTSPPFSAAAVLLNP